MLFLTIQLSISHFCTLFKYQIVLFNPWIGTYQVLPLWFSVNLGGIAIKEYSAFPKFKHYWSLTIRLFCVISETLVGEVLTFCRDAVSVIYSPRRLGSVYLDRSFSLIPIRLKKTPNGISWLRHWRASDSETLVLEVWGIWSTCSLILLPGPLWSGVVAPFSVLSIGQIDLLKTIHFR